MIGLKRNLFLLSAMSVCACAFGQEKILTVEVENGWKNGKTDEPVVIRLDGVKGLDFVVRSADVTDAKGERLAYQLDDMDGDMKADELVFLTNIGAKEKHLEGLFAPDTYHFHAGVSDLEILKAAYEHQQAILTHEWSNRGKNCVVKSPYEALILASIVEREVARSEDRFIVAGIFSNRLRIKMPLQTDPSVIYGEGENFEGRLRRKHLDRNTPYNTYRFVGLPPTPIGNPTQESIHAVMHPAKTDYLYFINKENGDLVASKTLQEHNRAVNRYIRNSGK